eukprot:13244151-Heterocapsa_arctica.AAC.1
MKWKTRNRLKSSKFCAVSLATNAAGDSTACSEFSKSEFGIALCLVGADVTGASASRVVALPVSPSVVTGAPASGADALPPSLHASGPAGCYAEGHPAA